MRGDQTRLDLYIDVLDKKDQLAQAQADLRAADLVRAILEEFRELEYLANDIDSYNLLKAPDGLPLNLMMPLAEQVSNDERLILAEVEVPIPDGARRPSKDIYLRETDAGSVYKLRWSPAIIGRPDPARPRNDLLAVNLADHEQGLRVSRRHAQVTEAGGSFYVEALSPHNSTFLQDELGNKTPIDSNRHPLKHGDIIYLEQSRIALKFIVRDAAPGGTDSDAH